MSKRAIDESIKQNINQRSYIASDRKCTK